MISLSQVPKKSLSQAFHFNRGEVSSKYPLRDPFPGNLLGRNITLQLKYRRMPNIGLIGVALVADLGSFVLPSTYFSDLDVQEEAEPEKEWTVFPGKCTNSLASA